MNVGVWWSSRLAIRLSSGVSKWMGARGLASTMYSSKQERSRKNAEKVPSY